MIEDNLGSKVLGKQGKIHAPSFRPPKPKAKKKTASQQEASDLGLRLLIRDDLSKNDIMRLQEDLVMFVRNCLMSNKTSEVEDFIIKHKDHFTAEMKDMVSLEIKLKGIK
jgi:hypothetical protein